MQSHYPVLDSCSDIQILDASCQVLSQLSANTDTRYDSSYYFEKDNGAFICFLVSVTSTRDAEVLYRVVFAYLHSFAMLLDRPADILTQVNRVLLSVLKADQTVDVALLMIKNEQGYLSMSTKMRGYYIHEQQCQVMPTQGNIGLGRHADTVYTEQEYALSSKDLLILGAHIMPDFHRCIDQLDPIFGMGLQAVIDLISKDPVMIAEASIILCSYRTATPNMSPSLSFQLGSMISDLDKLYSYLNLFSDSHALSQIDKFNLNWVLEDCISSIMLYGGYCRGGYNWRRSWRWHLIGHSLRFQFFFYFNFDIIFIN